MGSCSGVISATLLSPLPAPLVVGLQLMDNSPRNIDLANRFKQVYSTYQQNRDLITVGAYRRGSDPRVDLAVDQWPKILEFLRQDMYEPLGIERSRSDLRQLVTHFSAPAAPPAR